MKYDDPEYYDAWVTEMLHADAPNPPGTKKRDRTAIADSEWIVTIQLEVKDEALGLPLTLRYADSAVAKGAGLGVGSLIATALNNRAIELKPRKKRAKTK